MTEKPVFNARVVFVTGQVDRQEVDEKAFPFKFHANFMPPEFMGVAFAFLHGGSQDVIVRCDTLETCLGLIDYNQYHTHPKLRWIRIYGKDDVLVGSLSRKSLGKWISADIPSESMGLDEVNKILLIKPQPAESQVVASTPAPVQNLVADAKPAPKRKRNSRPKTSKGKRSPKRLRAVHAT